MTTETPCLSGCREYYLSPSIPTKHALGCPNAPKPAEPAACTSSRCDGVNHWLVDQTFPCPVRPVEPPACECGAAIGHVCHAAECVPVCAYHAVTCPARKAAEPLACKCGGGNRVPNVAHTPDGCYSVPDAPHHWAPAYSHPDAAAMCGVCGADWTPTIEPCPGPKQPQGSEGSEPPIDYAAWAKIADWHIKERPQHAMTGLCRAFKSLKAERDELPADWRKDSSLTTWFPFTAKELADLKAERDAIRGWLGRIEREKAALKARVEVLTAAANRVVKRRNRHYKRGKSENEYWTFQQMLVARIAADAEIIAAREAAYDQAQEGLKSARKQESEMRETIRKQAEEIERLKGRLSSVPDLVEAWADETRKARDQVRVLREALKFYKPGKHALLAALAATEPKGDAK